MSEPTKEQKLLLDAATLLDDCLVQIYPEEFTADSIKDAVFRFSEGGGTVARIDEMVCELREMATCKNQK